MAKAEKVAPGSDWRIPLRTADAVVEAVASASFEDLPITETEAVIRTASGTTFVVPVALIVMYRVPAAFAGADRPAPPIKAIARDRAAIVRRVLGFML